MLPLLLHGISCGHDFDFHVLSWIEVAAQMRHGVLLPHWAYTPAYNAGEPRFVFYPPLSWLLGALLTLVLPPNTVPVAFTAAALVLAGAGMWALARQFTGRGGALLATAAYLANPYMLFTAFERTAFAELLAAAWLPWLLRAALAERPGVLPVAVPLALLWLTNAPAAVMGTYAFCLLALLRVGHSVRQPHAATLSRGERLRQQLPALRAAAGGLLLGLALAGFYLLPAAYERRYVQIAMAIIPNMRVEDNFLFGHTGNGPHDQVLHTASLVAVSLLAVTVVVLVVAFVGQRRSSRQSRAASEGNPLLALLTLALCIAVLLRPFSMPLWHLLPELSFLQFPWRWLAVLGCVLGAGVALLVGPRRPALLWAAPLSLVLVATASTAANSQFRQGCEVKERPQERLALVETQHGVVATDEYTPTTADNDQLRWDDPAWWLTPDPNAPGPNTVPNPAATIENYDQPPPLEQTISASAPTHLHLNVDHPTDLVLNLRDYPAWVVTINSHVVPHLQRDDGLIAVPLPAGADDIDVRWRRLPDVWLGDGVSLFALGIAGWLGWRSRRIKA